MIPAKEVNKLKKKYTEIYAITFGGIDIVYRPLTKKEFIYVVDRLEKGGEYNVDLEEEIVDMTVVYGKTDSLPGGSVSSLATKVLDSSGFSSLERQKELIEKYREDMSLLVEQAEALVLYVFNEKSDDMTFSELMHRFAQAEYILDMNYSHVQQGSFKLTFPWESSPKGKEKMENPTPMMANQKKMTLDMDQLQEQGMESAKRKLEKTVKTAKGTPKTEKKGHFNWHEDT